DRESPRRRGLANAASEPAPLSATEPVVPRALAPPQARATGMARAQCPSKNVRQQKCYQRVKSQLRYAAAAGLGQAHWLEVRQGEKGVLPEQMVRGPGRYLTRGGPR